MYVCMYVCTYACIILACVLYACTPLIPGTGTVPLIRCPRGNAAEMVGASLDKKIRDNLRDSRNNVFSGENMAFSQLRLAAEMLVFHVCQEKGNCFLFVSRDANYIS